MTATSPHSPADRAHPGGGRLETEVRYVMRPGVVTVTEDTSLIQLHRAMVSHGVHAVLIVGRLTGIPLGWVTSRGLLAWLDCDHELHDARVAISEPAVAIEPWAPAREAGARLVAEGVSHLIVSASGDHRPEGVIGDLDLVRLVAR